MPLPTARFVRLLLIAAVPALTHAESMLNASARPEPVSASARLVFRIVIPQSLAFSVLDQGGARGPALSLEVQLNSGDPLQLAPASLTRLPLVRCNPGAMGQTICTAATP